MKKSAFRRESSGTITPSGPAVWYVPTTLMAARSTTPWSRRAAHPQAASGAPWTATYFQSKGDPITDLHEDLAAEQKARTTYDNILRLIKDPEICDPIRFLREREIVHYQRFGESLRIVQEHLDSKNFYAINPEFEWRCSVYFLEGIVRRQSLICVLCIHCSKIPLYFFL